VSVDDIDAHGHSRGSAGSADDDDAEPATDTERDRTEEAATESMREMTRGRTPWGGVRPRPPIKMRLKWRMMGFLGRSAIVPAITHPVEHGDVLELADREWFVVHTPGHTGDHFCLHDPDTGLFVAGDHVLPTITPHISGISSSPDPLASFFYSLDRVSEIRGVENVLPAHGHPFDDLHDRVDAIKRHHFERLEKVKSISREIGRPANVEVFMQQLFKPRSWGAMAESETYAHLEHLRIAGDAERNEDDQGKYLYLTG
jgi:glyoxylase-like metal-dependent hydrolase (beta-lactamase superfamily II)